MRMWAASEAAEVEQSKESHILEAVKSEPGTDGERSFDSCATGCALVQSGNKTPGNVWVYTLGLHQVSLNDLRGVGLCGGRSVEGAGTCTLAGSLLHMKKLQEKPNNQPCLCPVTVAGPSTGSVFEVKAAVKAETGLEGRSSAAGDAPRPRQRPLDILHGILRDVGGRLVLNEAVLWARAATKAPDGRWARLLRIEQARILPLGIRYIVSQF